MTVQAASPTNVLPLDLIPHPVHVEYGNTSLSIGSSVTLVADFPVDWMSNVPIRDLMSDFDRSCAVTPVIRVTATDDEGTIVRLTKDDEIDGEAYALDVTDDGIVIRFGQISGVRYGIQTLRQMLRQCHDSLPEIRIWDCPVFRKRAYSLDVTRGRVPTRAFFTWFIDQLALYKYNQFQLYVEHSFAFSELSEAWRGCDPLTADDIELLDGYCATRGIEFVPSLATFGHMYMNLRTNTHRCLSEFPDDAERPFSFVERMEHHTLNAADPKALEFSCRLIQQYGALFRSQMFNIGCDETFDLGRGKSLLDSPDAGREALYADFVQGLCDSLGNREPMLWADIALDSPLIMGRLPRNLIMLNWMYEPDIDERKIEAIEARGYRQYVCPAVRAWSRFIPDYDGAWRNISAMTASGRHHHAEGVLITDWGDYGHINDPRLSLPGVCYGAQQAWNPEPIDVSDMNRRISRLVYGANDGRLMDTLSVIEHDGVSFPWDVAVLVLELDGGGTLNRDVFSRVQSIYGVADTSSSTEARCRLLDAERSRIGTRTACESVIERCRHTAVRELRGRARSLNGGFGNSGAADMDFVSEGMANCICVMLEGQRLFNELGSALLDIVDGKWDGKKSMQLAASLELWFEEYRSQWLSIGRAAELERIAHVVWSFADMLRKGQL